MQTWWRLGGVGGVLVLGGLGTAIAGPPPDATGPAAVPCPAPSMPAPPVVVFPPPGARVPANVEVRVELGAEHSTVAATARTRPVALEERVTPAKRHLAVRPRSPLAGGTVLALAQVSRSAPAGRPPATRALGELTSVGAVDRAPPRLVAVGTPTWAVVPAPPSCVPDPSARVARLRLDVTVEDASPVALLVRADDARPADDADGELVLLAPAGAEPSEAGAAREAGTSRAFVATLDARLVRDGAPLHVRAVDGAGLLSSWTSTGAVPARPLIPPRIAVAVGGFGEAGAADAAPPVADAPPPPRGGCGR